MNKIQKYKRLVNEYNKSMKLLDDLVKKYVNIAKDQLNDKYRSIISEWYADIYLDSKDPHMYKRNGSLVHAFRVTVKQYDISVEYDSQFMSNYTHRVSNDYIFENSFIEGYHGGARYNNKTPDQYPHPNPGVPYWKQYGNYHEWGAPATRSFSPYERMEEAFPKIISHVDKMLTNAGRKQVIIPLKSAILQYLK